MTKMAAKPRQGAQRPAAACTDTFIAQRGAESATRVLCVSLPLPGRLLSPNGRAHWTAIRAAKETARWRAKLAARELLLDQPTPYFPAGARVRVTATAWPRQRNHEHDDDNLKASTKSYWDGFTDAGVWADDQQAIWGDVVWEEPGERRGLLVLTIAAEE